VTKGRVLAARVAAILADITQIVLFPLFAGGAASPWNDGLDLVVGAALTALIGWHWAFLPSFFVELVPGLDLVPTWTMAVFFATRAGASPPATQDEEARGVIETEIVSSEKLSPESGGRPSPQPSPAGRGRGL
jgi:hypothetical protein